MQISVSETREIWSHQMARVSAQNGKRDVAVHIYHDFSPPLTPQSSRLQQGEDMIEVIFEGYEWMYN